MRLKLFLLAVTSDQILKFIALKFLHPAFNSGIAFGMGKNVPIAIVMAVFLILALLVYKNKSGIGEIFLLAGGAGNILDRLITGNIVDWIRVGSLWFNLADVYIVMGIAVIMVNALRGSCVNKSMKP